MLSDLLPAAVSPLSQCAHSNPASAYTAPAGISAIQDFVRLYIISPCSVNLYVLTRCYRASSRALLSFSACVAALISLFTVCYIITRPTQYPPFTRGAPCAVHSAQSARRAACAMPSSTWRAACAMPSSTWGAACAVPSSTWGVACACPLLLGA